MLQFIIILFFYNLHIRNLKTSHVTVYHAEQKQQYEMDKYLKTSHVTVYRIRRKLKAQESGNLKTSHVTVYL